MPAAGAAPLSVPDVLDPTRLFFQQDRMFLHNVLRVNYTTYDVRRKQDTINPNTSHRDVMVLANNNDDSEHPFLYGRVVGILHVNMIYTGGPTIDYRPRKIEVLWVRWFEHDTNAPTGSWSDSRLDRLRFPPMAGEFAFGFLDPADIVRGCHIIPAFSTKTRYSDGRGISPCARDASDWQSYYLNRYASFTPAVTPQHRLFFSFVDRDMVMRFHWGLGVGHAYTHQQLCTNAAVVWNSSESESNQSFQSRNVPEGPEPSDQMGMGTEEDIVDSGTGTDGSGSESDDEEYEPSEGDDDDESSDDDEYLLDIDEMYGLRDSGDDLSEDS